MHGDWNQARYPLEELGALPGVQLTASNDHDFELVPDRVDKGRAMALIALLYGVPLGETAAVGDSDNDLSMLRAAGLPSPWAMPRQRCGRRPSGPPPPTRRRE